MLTELCAKFVLFSDVDFCIEIIIIIIIIIIMLLNKRFSYMYMSNNENVRGISEAKNAIRTLIRALKRTRNYSLDKTCLNMSSLVRPLRIHSAGFKDQSVKLTTFSNLLFAGGISGVLHPRLLVDSRHFSHFWINCFKQSIFGLPMCYLVLNTSLCSMNKVICVFER